MTLKSVRSSLALLIAPFAVCIHIGVALGGVEDKNEALILAIESRRGRVRLAFLEIRGD
jgi:hypothetical protein